MSNVLTRLRLRRTKSADATEAVERAPRTRFGAWLGRPMTSFHLIIAVTALLVTLGLTMVLSASGVHSYDEDGSPWAIFARQVLWTVVGLLAFYIALRMPVQLMRSLSFSGFALTTVMLVLVLIPGIGKEANGSRGWFVVAGLSMQPSELAKIAFAIWGAHLLAARRMDRDGLEQDQSHIPRPALHQLHRSRSEQSAKGVGDPLPDRRACGLSLGKRRRQLGQLRGRATRHPNEFGDRRPRKLQAGLGRRRCRRLSVARFVLPRVHQLLRMPWL